MNLLLHTSGRLSKDIIEIRRISKRIKYFFLFNGILKKITFFDKNKEAKKIIMKKKERKRRSDFLLWLLNFAKGE